MHLRRLVADTAFTDRLQGLRSRLGVPMPAPSGYVAGRPAEKGVTVWRKDA